MLGSAKANAEIGAAAGFDTLSKPISRPTQAESSRTIRSRSKREKCGLSEVSPDFSCAFCSGLLHALDEGEGLVIAAALEKVRQSRWSDRSDPALLCDDSSTS